MEIRFLLDIQYIQVKMLILIEPWVLIQGILTIGINLFIDLNQNRIPIKISNTSASPEQLGIKYSAVPSLGASSAGHRRNTKRLKSTTSCLETGVVRMTNRICKPSAIRVMR